MKMKITQSNGVLCVEGASIIFWYDGKPGSEMLKPTVFDMDALRQKVQEHKP